MKPVHVGACLWLAWLVTEDGTTAEMHASQAWKSWKSVNLDCYLTAQSLGRRMYEAL